MLGLLLTLALLFAATLPEDRRSLIDTRGPLHPYLHIAAFTLVAFLAAWSTRSSAVRVLLCLGVTLLGCVTEITEWRLYHNPLEWTDIVLDAMGAVAGIGLGALTVALQRVRRGRFPDEF